VIANKFIPMKTPLDERYDQAIRDLTKVSGDSYLFRPHTVFEVHHDKKIGLWVDLNKAYRYYNGEVAAFRSLSLHSA